MKNRVTVLGAPRRRAHPVAARVEFDVAYDVPPSRVIAVVPKALAHAEIRNVATRPPLIVHLRGFGDSGDPVRRSATGCTDLAHDLLDRFAGAAARRRGARAPGMEIPFPQRVLIQRSATDAPERRERELARALRDARANRAVRRAHRRRAARARGASSPTARTSRTTSSHAQGEPADSLYHPRARPGRRLRRQRRRHRRARPARDADGAGVFRRDGAA